MPKSTNWLRLDEHSNAIDNLEMCSYFLRNLPDPIRWKWAIIAIHQALYGFAVAAVQGTDCTRVRQNPIDPNSKLISVWEAIRRAKDSKHLWAGRAPLLTTPDEDRALDKVIGEFRNGFEHFAPAGWSIEVSGMPELFGYVLRVVQGIALGAQSHHVYGAYELARLRTALGCLAADLGIILPAA